MSSIESNLDRYGGHDVEFVNPMIAAEYECPICHLALKDAIQFEECGHRFCESCFNESNRFLEDSSVCPIGCGENKIFKDIAARRAVSSLFVYCKNRNKNCEWKGALSSMEVHTGDCKHMPLECINNCGVCDIPKEEMESHLSTCSLTVITCCYFDIGCKFKGASDAMDKHIKIATQDHLAMSVLKARENQTSLKQMEEHIREIEKRYAKQMVDHSKQMEEQSKQIEERYTKLMYDHLKQMEEHSKQVEEHSKQFEECCTKQIQKYSNELERCFANVQNDLSALQKTVSTCNFIWEIESFNQQLICAKRYNEKISSASFYTTPCGYKLSLIAHLNVYDRKDIYRSHISLYLCIMKGKYDAVLEWPFNKKCTLYLLHQETQKKHVMATVVSKEIHVADRFCNRPIHESSEGIVLSTMISHNDLFAGDFIKDDTIFFKCEIEN